ncbi:MAG: FAD-dependent oxidoreductase [Candidatus Bathyarchaeota archaeon]|jgi:flavin-dependent dehydrogenase|nr:FAD-dependent oxidoreductase [Candidatus Bathyarchaeota archaeon]
MEQYDVIVVGGGIAGSVAARFSAKQGYKTLLFEKYKTPRNKPCSGIQFTYFEKLIGKKIPKDKLCENELFKVDMVTPQGKTMKGKMKMFNFWRSTFDSWLNEIAQEDGAIFHDNTSLVNFEKNSETITITVEKEGK